MSSHGSDTTERPWQDQRVAFTGRLGSLTRREALALLTRCGGQFSASVTRSTTTLVVGTLRWPLDRRGRLTRKLQRARLLQQQGDSIEVINEDQFLDRALPSHARQSDPFHYLLSDLERILGMTRDRLRSFLRTGLIEPAQQENGVPLFRFQDLQRIRHLVHLLDQGASVQQVRRSLQRLSSLYPWVGNAADGLKWIAAWGPEVVLRSPEGALLLPNGQRLFDFDATNEPTTVSLPRDLYAEAVGWEAEQNWEGAIAAYEALLQQEGEDAEVRFQLGNARYANHQLEEAAREFRQAVTLDRRYVEAWNNLGNVLAQLGRHSEAIIAYSTAVKLDPQWTDARFGLADVLDESGQTAQAAKHWRMLAMTSIGHEYADYARQRLRNA